MPYPLLLCHLTSLFSSLTNFFPTPSVDGGQCAPLTAGAQCLVIRGKTSILLDDNVVEVKDTAYAIISKALNNVGFLRDFSGMDNLVRSAFIRSIGENLVLRPLDDKNDTTTTNGSTLKVIISASLISVLVTALLAYGLHRYRKSKDPSSTTMKARVAHYQAKRRRYFEELEENERQSGTPGWMTAEIPQLPEASITWSVSDLTSDSQSIRSSLPMERIAEEGSAERDDSREYEDCEISSNSSISNSPSSSPQETGSTDQRLEDHMHFIAHWQVFQQETSASAPVTTDLGIPYPGVTLDSDMQGGGASVENSESDATPVHGNREDDYDEITPGDHHSELYGCHYLEDGLDGDSSSSTSNNSDTEANEADTSRASTNSYGSFLLSPQTLRLLGGDSEDDGTEEEMDSIAYSESKDGSIDGYLDSPSSHSGPSGHTRRNALLLGPAVSSFDYCGEDDDKENDLMFVAPNVPITSMHVAVKKSQCLDCATAAPDAATDMADSAAEEVEDMILDERSQTGPKEIDSETGDIANERDIAKVGQMVDDTTKGDPDNLDMQIWVANVLHQLEESRDGLKLLSM